MLVLKAFLALLVVLVQWLLYNIFVFYQRKRTFAKIPGPRMFPLFGNSLDLAVPNEAFLNQLQSMCRETKGKVMRIFIGKSPYVVLTGPKGFEAVLGSNKHITKGGDYLFLEPWMGTGLLTANGQKWRSRRKMLTPSFHFSILDDFLAVMGDHSNVLVQKIHSILVKQKAEGRTDATINIFPLVTLCALDIICDAAMGRTVDAQSKEDSPYVKSTFAASDIIFQRMRSPWLWPDKIFNLHPFGRQQRRALSTLHSFTDSVIKERKAALINEVTDEKEVAKDDVGQKRRLAFLDLMLQMQRDQGMLTDADIREEVDTFMFEGHDTTAANMSFTLLMLAMHPNIQSKVIDELDAIFGDDHTRRPTTADLSNMKYLECCIKESLRLFPSVPLITRRLREDAMIEGHLVPSDTTILLFVYQLHRDPEQFEKPEQFDPGRFADEGPKRRHPYSYVPFSAGNRNCIGQKFAQMEEKVLVSTVLRSFRLSTELKSVDLLPELVLRPNGGAPITIEPRHK